MGFVGPIVPDEGANGTKDTNDRASVPSVPIVPPAFLEDEGEAAGVDPDWDDADLWDIDKLLG